MSFRSEAPVSGRPCGLLLGSDSASEARQAQGWACVVDGAAGSIGAPRDTRPKPACPSAHSWVSRPGRFPSVSQRAFVGVSTAPCPAHDSAGLGWGGGLPRPLGQRRPTSTPLDRCHCNHGVTLPFSRERCPLPGQRPTSECLGPQRTEDRSTTAFSFNDEGARPPLPEV